MASNKNFFESPQAAAVYKHKLLKTYIPAWAGKVGSTSTGRRVVVYDAYSGPGRYDDSQPGSPELLVDTALAMANLRSVFTIFSEKDSGYCRRLKALMAEKNVPQETFEIREGPVEGSIDAVLGSARDLPLFVFLDPYGLTVPFETVVHILSSRLKPGWSAPLQPKTELLMNFSYEAVRRIAGVLRSEAQHAAREGQIRALNEALGGTWWQPIAENEEGGWIEEVLNGYATRVAQAAQCGFITAAVADSLTASPVYELILFTRHPDGLWKMMEAMSLARREWRQWLVERKEEARGGQTELRGLDWDDNELAWVHEIEANLTRLLDESETLRVDEKLGEVLGRTLGLARERHIRQALKFLKQSRVINVVPTGSLQKAQIARS